MRQTRSGILGGGRLSTGVSHGGLGFSQRGLLKLVVRPFEHQWHVAGLATALELLMIGREHVALDALPSICVDRMGNVGVQLEPAGHAIAQGAAAMLVEARSTIVAEAGAKMILLAAFAAMITQLA